MDVQFILTPQGDELAVMPRAEYEALLRRTADLSDDQVDAGLARRALASLEVGHDVAIPEAVWKELEAGGSRLRILRSWRGMTQAQLAAAAGVAQPNISDAERAGAVGARIGLKLSRALKVPLEVLLGED